MDGIDTQEHLEAIPLERIDPSPTNPRKRFDPTKLQELADSIRSKGLISPVVLRPITGTRYELVVGERRYRASKLADCPTILALVRTLTDREVCELQLEENGQREDVHPLEEADAYQHLQRQGAAVEELAARTGKSVSYVRQRMQYCALGTEGREAFLDGKLTPATALLVARIPGPKLQADAVKELTRIDYQGEVMGARQAGDHIRGRYMLQLAAAPFDRGDAKLIDGVPACTTCPKRTGAQPELFADVKSPDTCTDPNCFAAKKDADWSKRTAEAKAKGISVLSEKETKKLFPYGSSLAYGAEFVDVGEKDHAIGEGKKSIKATLKGQLPPVVLARDPSGGVHELVKKADLTKACKAAGITAKPMHVSPSNDAEKKAREKMVLMRTTQERALGQLVEKVEGAKIDHAFWLLLAQLVVHHAPADVTKAVVKRRGIEETKKLEGESALAAAMEAMKDAPLRALIIERLCAAPPYSYASSYNDHLTIAAAHFGVDLKAIENEVKAELTAKKKAKGKPAAPKGKTSKPAAKASKGAAKAAPPKPKPVANVPVWIAVADLKKLHAERLQDYSEPDFDVTIAWSPAGEYSTALVDVDAADLLIDMTVDDGIKLYRNTPPPGLAPSAPSKVAVEKASTKTAAAQAAPAPPAMVLRWVAEDCWKALSHGVGAYIPNALPEGGTFRELGPFGAEAAADLDDTARILDITLHATKPEEPPSAPPPAKASTKKPAAAPPERGTHASQPHSHDVRATTSSANVACLVILDSNGTRVMPRPKKLTDEAWRKEVAGRLAGASMVLVARLYSQRGECVWDSRDSEFNGKPVRRFFGLAAGERITLDGAEVDVLWVSETELLWRGLGADAPKDGELVPWKHLERIEGATWRTKAVA